MKNLQDPTYSVPQWALDVAIEGLQELARRLEADAVHAADDSIDFHALSSPFCYKTISMKPDIGGCGV